MNIKKTLMSPSVFMSKSDNKVVNEDKKYKEIKRKITSYKKFIKDNFKYVGTNFAYEARSIYYKEKKAIKGIYGTATKKDLKDLAFFLLCPSKLAIPINTWLSCFLSSTLSISSSIESTKICRIRCPSPAGNTATQ